MQTIQGKIIQFIPKQEGESSNGHWVKAGFVIEYGDEYPKKAAFTLFGEQKMQLCKGINVGSIVIVSYRPESREYNERWYTDLTCINLEILNKEDNKLTNTQTQQVQHQEPQQPKYQQSPVTEQKCSSAPTASNTMPEDDGLPF